jgi:hypothetical protein
MDMRNTSFEAKKFTEGSTLLGLALFASTCPKSVINKKQATFMITSLLTLC